MKNYASAIQNLKKSYGVAEAIFLDFVTQTTNFFLVL